MLTIYDIHTRIKKDDAGCWLWTGYKNSLGYGQVSIGSGVMKYVHRIMWELSFGSIPDGILVLHRCDVPSCCNPEHLFLGTHQDNMADMQNKGRRAKGVMVGSSILDPDQVREIRAWSSMGLGGLSIGKLMGIARGTVDGVLLGRTWGWVQ